MEYSGALKQKLDNFLDNTTEPDKWRTYAMAELIIREWEEENHLLPDEAIGEYTDYIIAKLGV